MTTQQVGDAPRLLVVVAHPDDESFGTGSVIASAAAAGYEVTICCATRGEAGEAREVAPGADLAQIRAAELHAAADILGATRCILLNFTDSGMSGDPAPGTLCAAAPVTVSDAVRAVVTEVDPDLVVTLDPDHGDGHRDHSAIARATLAACQDYPTLPVYAWALSRNLLTRWFDELHRLRPSSEHLDLDREGLGRPEADITTVLDVSHVLDVRERAIAAHASQISPYDGMPPELRDDFLRTDRLIQLQPERPGGQKETQRWLQPRPPE